MDKNFLVKGVQFQKALLLWFRRHKRDLPWRHTKDPWHILISEVMLQQTQVERVISKYEDFIKRWPTPSAMASASPGEVLRLWSGLGYNRRALNLWRGANEVSSRYNGLVPRDVETLETLSGIGRYTARAIASFAYNQDVALWDTNIRRIFLRFFFGGEFAQSLPNITTLESLLEDSLPYKKSRKWHSALMDFGSMHCTSKNPSCAECPVRNFCLASPGFLAHHERKNLLLKKQPKFEGSRRQIRGEIIRTLVSEKMKKGLTLQQLSRKFGHKNMSSIIDDLWHEGLLKKNGERVMVAE